MIRGNFGEILLIIEMRKRYDVESNNMQRFRMKLANVCHGSNRKTLVYNVGKGYVTFPHKEMVSKCQIVILSK